MRYMREQLLNIDYFAQPVRLTFNGRKKYPTEIGSLLSLSIFVLIITLIIMQGNDMINHLRPKVNQMDLYLIDQPIIDISDRTLMFNFQFLTSSFQPNYDPSYFTFNLQNFVVNREKIDNPISLSDVLLENCTLHYESFQKNIDLSKEFQNNYFSESFCLANHEGKMGGRFSSNFFSNFKFSIVKCNNETSKVTCKTNDEINKFFDGAYLEFYFVDKYINTENYTNPFQYFLNTYFISLDPSSYKFVDIYFKTAKVVTDKGFLFEDTYTEKEILYDYVREQFSVYKSGTNVIDFYINSSFNFVNVTRYYMKIQDLAAATGGILKMFLIVGLFISKVFNENKMLQSILNTLYQFDIDDDKVFYNNRNGKKSTSLNLKGGNVNFKKKKSKVLKELELMGFINKSLLKKNTIHEKSISIKNNESKGI
jgi:hypothetical protein